MILKALTLENFKGIREPVRVEFAPLTLLFGANNAGKSTIMQALIYAREVLERNNCDAGKTELGGDVVDLGGFKNLVHAHDYQNRTIRMRFELDLRGCGLPDYTESVREHELEGTVHCEENSPARPTNVVATELAERDLWVEFEVAWAKQFGEAFVRSYRVGTGESTYAAVEYDSGTGDTAVTHLNCGILPFGTRALIDIAEASSPNDPDSPKVAHETAASKATRRDVRWKAEGWFIDLLKSLVKARIIPVHQYECETEFLGNLDRAMRLPSPFIASDYYGHSPGPMPLLPADPEKTTALPKWGSRIRVRNDAWEDYEEFDGDWNWEYPYFAQEYLSDVLTTLITGPGERLVEALRTSAYLSLFRDVPSRQYTPVHSPGANRWANGMAAWDWLVLDPTCILKPTNQWLGANGLNSGYRVEVPRYLELETIGPIMAALTKDHAPSEPDWDWIRHELGKLQERTRLQIRNLRTNTILFPRDLGFGISQVIPVIVAALHHESGVVAIEEPESNIHPGFQVVLADLFITQAKANRELMFLIETHSEHLMLRCLRRIRESAKGTLPEGLPSVAPADVAVHFVETTKEGPKIKRIEIDEEGDFIDEWPGGFFEESFREKFSGR